jgi:iron complex transport system substrate-binding protein
MSHHRLHAWLPLAVLVLALSATAAVVDHATPAALLRPPDRPYRSAGDPRVRTQGQAFPRTAIGADGTSLTLARPPRRIASESWSIDDLAYSVVPPERVVAVSESAYLERLSNVLSHVARFHPAIASDAERTLRTEPDLALVSSTTRSDFPELLRAAGVPTYRMLTIFSTLAQIEDHIRLLGYLSGEDARAATQAARFHDAILRAAARRPAGAHPRVLGLGGRYSYGAQTLFHDICRVLGAVNVSGNDLVGYDSASAEQIIRWDPEWIIAGAEPGRIQETRQRLLEDPALAVTQAAARKQIVVLEHRVFLPLSPYTTLLIEAMADALYPRARS